MKVVKKRKGEKREMVMREKIVMLVVKQESNDVVGGYENSISDGHINVMPVREDLLEEIYNQVMMTTIVEGNNCRMSVEKDIRFIGSKKIKELIEARLDKLLK